MFAFIHFRSSRRVTRCARRIAAVAAFCLAASGAHANGALSFAEALSLAETRSSALSGADYAAQASREMAVAAAQLPDPVATMGINNLPVNGPDAWSLTRDFMTMASVGVMQEFTRADKREARAERFGREADKAVAERAAACGHAAAQHGDGVARPLLRGGHARRWLREQSRQARAEIEAAEAAYRAGRGNLADILAARSALVMLDDRASEFGRKVRAARIALARWVGDRADAPLAGRPAIDSPRARREGARRGTPAPPGNGHAHQARKIWRQPKSGWRRPTASPTGASR